MQVIKNSQLKEVSNLYAVKDKAVKTITNVYSIVKGKAVLVWTAIKDVVAGVFSQGYWQNREGWNNQDMWKNRP